MLFVHLRFAHCIRNISAEGFAFCYIFFSAYTFDCKQRESLTKQFRPSKSTQKFNRISIFKCQVAIYKHALSIVLLSFTTFLKLPHFIMGKDMAFFGGFRVKLLEQSPYSPDFLCFLDCDFKFQIKALKVKKNVLGILNEKCNFT
jgi:hypothetical protein